MKKIIGAAFCMLLAGGAMVQSCKKPETAPDTVAPVAPVDSTKPDGPLVPLTEQGIVQKAIKDLSGDYLMTGRDWYMYDVSVLDIIGPGNHVMATDTGGVHQGENNPALWTKKVTIPTNDSSIIQIGTYSIRNNSNSFYNKILVDEVGDSFIGAMCGANDRFGICTKQQILGSYNYVHDINNHKENTNNIDVSLFRNVSLYNNVKVDSGKYGIFFDKSAITHIPTDNGLDFYNIKYYYNKDSLVLFKSDIRNTFATTITATRYVTGWRYIFGYSYGKKIK